MRDSYFVCLRDDDLGQLLDGLDARHQAWLKTAEYLAKGEDPKECFVAEECSDAEEAHRIAARYERITSTIRRQREVQDSYAPRDQELPPPASDGSRPGFCIYVDTRARGPVPVERDEKGNPVVYPTPQAAERQIANVIIERLQEFFAGEREFGDAMTVEEYIVPVDVLADGSVVDETDGHFGVNNW